MHGLGWFLFSFSSFSRLRPYFGCFLASFLPHPVSPFLICCLAAVNCASSCLISSLPPHSLPHERVTRSLLFLPFMDIESGVTRVLQDLKYSILKSRLPCVGAFKRYIACERISVWDMPRGRLLPCRVPFSCRAAVCAGPYTAPVARSPCARIHSGRRSGHGIRNHFLWLFLSLSYFFSFFCVFFIRFSSSCSLSLSLSYIFSLILFYFFVSLRLAVSRYIIFPPSFVFSLFVSLLPSLSLPVVSDFILFQLRSSSQDKLKGKVCSGQHRAPLGLCRALP